MIKIIRLIPLLLIVSLLLLGCSNSEYESKKLGTMSELKPREDGQYHMYVFFDFPNDETLVEPSKQGEVVDEYLQRQYDIYNTMMTMNPVTKVNRFGVKNAQNVPEQVDALNIKDFPTFVILDNTGIVLISTDMDETAEFLQTLPDI